MYLVTTKAEINTIVNQHKKEAKKVGFVPTMGALHLGHITLVKQSVAENDVTVVSIFVNPTQFNDKNDLKNYPRTLEADLTMLNDAGVDYVFNPTETEMYPEPDNRVFDFGMLDKVMEGAHRPGHFNGVAQVVSRLFDAVPSDNAYFGLKDFQQLAIIKQLVKFENRKINIIPCDIVREPDGLAMSSRNLLLSDELRAKAPAINKALKNAAKLYKSITIKELKAQTINEINNTEGLEVEYFEISDDTYLQPIENNNFTGNAIACVAVKAGKIRLIDNIMLK